MSFGIIAPSLQPNPPTLPQRRLLLNFGGRISIESINQQSSSFIPVVLKMKLTETSSLDDPPGFIINLAVKYPFVPSGEKSALSIATAACSNNALLSSEKRRNDR